MRFILRSANGVLAALFPAACSDDGVSGSLPGSLQALTAHSSGSQHTGIAASPIAACSSKYYECATISKIKPFRREWCVVKKGTTGCKHLSPGTWSWSAPVTTVSGKKFARIVTSFKPNPGNPTELTIAEKDAVASSDGKVAYEASLKGCNTSKQCLAPVFIGVITR